MAFEPTEDQQKVINHNPTRHGRVLAGPGTGKSSTAVKLAEHLAELDPRPRVKFLTFTRAATAELVKKVNEAGQDSTSPSTLHSFAISILLRNPGSAPIPEPLRIVDDWEKENLVRKHLSDIMEVDVRGIDDLLDWMAAKWESLNHDYEEPNIPAALRNRFVGVLNTHRRLFGYTLLQELPELLRGALRDYDDLEGLGHDLLVVDEYQDLNACDLEVLSRLAGRGTRILAVGDDDQSIYSFRKAAPEGIRRFPADYPGADEYTLTFCHRLNASIGKWAQFVIDSDVARAPRPALNYAEDAPEGLAALVGFKSEVAEARGVAGLVKWMTDDEGIDASDILVLFRSDYQSRFSKPVREELLKLGISVVDTKRAKELLAEPAARQMLAILHLIVNPRDSLSWWTLMKLRKGIGQKAVDEIFALALERNSTFGEVLVSGAPDFASHGTLLGARMAALWNETKAMIDGLVPDIPQTSGAWGALITGWCAADRLPHCSDEILRLVTKADDPDTELAFGEFVTRFGLRLQEQAEADQSGVRCMTMSSSKGLTAQACIVVGVEDSLIPWQGADISEERRLLYVAMTRARQHLVMTWVEWRRGQTAHSGSSHSGRRRPTFLLDGGPVESQPAGQFFASD